jgi:hypothetical protein
MKTPEDNIVSQAVKEAAKRTFLEPSKILKPVSDMTPRTWFRPNVPGMSLHIWEAKNAIIGHMRSPM